MNVITNGLIYSLNWIIWAIDILFNNWYPDGSVINVTALTDASLDRLLVVINLTASVIRYLQPLLPSMDATTLNYLINALIITCESLFRFWAASQNVLDAGDIDIGHYEAIEVYQGILYNALQNLRGLVVDMQGRLT